MTDETRPPEQEDPPRRRLVELAVLFLRLGTTAFGGPAAHIAMMEEEVVRRRKWLSSEEYLDLLGATNLIPGPNSTEMAIHIGRMRAGWAGLLVAGTCFILPAAAITLALAWFYVRFGTVPRATRVLYGIKPVMIAVIVQALWSLGRKAVKTRLLAVLGVIATVAVVAGIAELFVLFGTGFIAMVLSKPSVERKPSCDEKAAKSSIFGFGAGWPWAASASSVVAASSWSLFLVFAKIGSVLFGSGYVLLAFLRADLVEQRHWLTEGQLIDAVAIGQLTPGPVFTTATFVGFLIDGLGGAAAATVGIFLPAFVFVALSGLILPRLRASKRAGGFLDGVNVASLALMAVVTLRLGRASIADAVTVVIAAASALALFRWKVNSAWLIVGGALAGFALSALR